MKFLKKDHCASAENIYPGARKLKDPGHSALCPGSIQCAKDSFPMHLFFTRVQQNLMEYHSMLKMWINMQLWIYSQRLNTTNWKLGCEASTYRKQLIELRFFEISIFWCTLFSKMMPYFCQLVFMSIQNRWKFPSNVFTFSMKANFDTTRGLVLYERPF